MTNPGQKRCAHWRVARLTLLALVATACLAPPPPVAEPPPPAVAAGAGDSAAQAPAAVTVRADSQERAARALTLRVRASGCDGVATGSGFAIAGHALVTNRHVIANASEIQVNTWDGQSLKAAVSRVTYYSDLALVVVDGDLPLVGMLAPRDAQVGDHVTVAGFPLGGQQTVADGDVLDYVVGANLGDGIQVMRLNATAQPGNSGGPVIDRRGEVVGVVYAIELATQHALAVPASAVRSLLREESVTPPTSVC
ncbi:MAG: S1C family serine protease [Egibacteraceae bacterium]